MPERAQRGGIDRRGFAAGALAGVLSGVLGPAAAEPVSLHQLARRKNLFFGCSIEGFRMEQDPAYARIVAQECGVATPEGALQWKALQPTDAPISFARMDGALAWSRQHGLWLRGHSVLWHEAVPSWVAESFQRPADWDRLVTPYIEATAARYAGSLRHWDVLNEALAQKEVRADGLRAWFLPRLMGEDYVLRAFADVHRAAPAVKLYYNDFGIEYSDRDSTARRIAMLRALERWRKAGVALHGVGVQGHLETRRGPTDAPALRRFLAEIAGLGLDIVISELDVREHRFDLSVEQRDQEVADHAQRFLDAALDEPRVRGVVAWGLSDRHSWLSWFHDKRNRGLPFDDALRPKPLLGAIANALRHAPDRPA